MKNKNTKIKRDLLNKLFIKSDNYEDEKVRLKVGMVCGGFGIFTNMLISICKIIIGLVTSTISVLADGINNLADAGSSIVTLVGFKLASQPEDEDHPFGHERMEYVTGLIVSVLILVIGILLFKSSVEKLISSEVVVYEKTFAIISLVILVGSILVKLLQARVYKKYGKLISSDTLLATFQDSINDCLSTGAIIISLIISIIYPNSFIDGIMGIIVSIMIIISGVKLVKETTSPLLGEAVSKELAQSISDFVTSYEGVLGVHDLIVHSYGPKKIFASMHVEVDSTVSINISHDIVDNIERDCFEKFGIFLVIHMDPVDLYDEDVKKYRELIDNIINEIDSSIHFHDFRIVKGQTHTNLIFDVLLPSKYNSQKKVIEEEITRRVKEKDNSLFVVITFDIDYVKEI